MPAGDVVYYVGPNVLALEKRFGFPPREFRLWLALHEVTHRVQFTGVPWMHDYFRGLVDATVNVADIDPKRFLDALRRSVEAVRDGRNPLDEGGLVALLAGPEQYETLQKTQGLMSLLEGHGDVTMDRAGRDRIPSAARFSATLHARRNHAAARGREVRAAARGPRRQDEAVRGGRAVHRSRRGRRAGPRCSPACGKAPEMLPTLGEIRDPARVDPARHRHRARTLALAK